MVQKQNSVIILILTAFVIGGAAFFYKAPPHELATNEQNEDQSIQDDKSIPNESSKSTVPPPSTTSLVKPSTPKPTTVSPPPSYPKTQQTGRILLTITDDTVPISNVSSVLVSISSIQARGTTGAWIPISNALHSYDLLHLKQENKPRVVQDIIIPADTYTKLSFIVQSAVIVKNGIANSAIFPSNTVSLPLTLPLRADQTAAIALDIRADKSLHTTVGGKLVFAPVVDVDVLGEIQTVQLSGPSVEFFGGLPKFTGSYGMDETGVMQKNSLGIDSLSHIEQAGGIFALIPRSLDRAVFIISPVNAVETAVTDGYLTRAWSIYAELLEKKPVWRVYGPVGSGIPTNVYVNAQSGSVEKVQ